MTGSKFITAAGLLVVSLLAAVSEAAFAITGPTGGVQPRLEVRQLFRENPDQWNLYLLALVQFQSNQQDYITSWYQIGGIHGAPNIPWDGVQQTGSGVGYCTHSMNLFPCWHRPYIALFEQKLQQAAVFKAGQFPAGAVRNRYLNLAQTLRAPYWDWAAAPPNGNPTLPLVVSAKYIDVNTPNGKQTIINPLFRYNFHPVTSDQVRPFGGPWNYWGATLRYPTNNVSQDAVSQNNLAQSTLDNNRISQRQSVYNWFTLCPTYDQISNDQPGGSSPDCHISLESLHNNIHVWIGGNNNGHMTVVPVSAWDPSFMLHHVMIDRLFALWQALYPNSYCGNEVSKTDTFTINKGSVQGPNSPLTPFHRNERGDFWTCASSRSVRTFGYTYPEFSKSDGSANSIRGYINRLYGPNASGTAGSIKKRGFNANNVPIVPTIATTASNGSTYQYIANVQSTRFKLDGSYTIYLFFGNPTSEDSSTWGTDRKMVGSTGVFSMPGMTGSDLITTSTVPLTDALTASVAGGLLQTLAEPLVVPYLKANLQWRVAMSTGQIIDPAAIPDFLISVVTSTMTVPSDPNAFPQWSPFTVLSQITYGKKGGLKFIDQLSLLGKK